MKHFVTESTFRDGAASSSTRQIEDRNAYVPPPEVAAWRFFDIGSLDVGIIHFTSNKKNVSPMHFRGKPRRIDELDPKRESDIHARMVENGWEYVVQQKDGQCFAVFEGNILHSENDDSIFIVPPPSPIPEPAPEPEFESEPEQEQESPPATPPNSEKAE